MKKLDPKQLGLHEHIGCSYAYNPLVVLEPRMFSVEFDAYVNCPKEEGTNSSICS